jgi:epoxide hydrolase-like predicted phosphatase
MEGARPNEMDRRSLRMAVGREYIPSAGPSPRFRRPARTACNREQSLQGSLAREGPVARSIDAVLFDFGGVFTASPFHAVTHAGVGLGARPGQIESIMFGPYQEDSDHTWHRLERGEITLAVAQQEIAAEGARQGLDFDPLAILASLGGSGALRMPLVDRVRALRAEGYATALLTNNVAEFRAHWRSMLPVEELFDLVVDSSEVGLRKPDPAIYRLTLERLGDVPPERTVFLDDLMSNVDAATALGIHGILVGDDPLAALADLDRFLDSAGHAVFG